MATYAERYAVVRRVLQEGVVSVGGSADTLTEKILDALDHMKESVR